MERIVGTFFSANEAGQALEDLRRSGFTYDQITMTEIQRGRKTDEISGGYDPVGGARLAGTAVNTLSASGFNIVGNSTTIDLSMAHMADVLEALAEEAEAETSNPRRRRNRIVAEILSPTEDLTQSALQVLKHNRARAIQVDQIDESQ